MPRSAQYDKSFNGYRLFIGNIGERVGKYDLEAEFDRFGPLIDIWVARNPPGFAYVVYKHRKDAEYAVRKLHGRYVCGKQVRVEYAKPYPGPPPNINYVPRYTDRGRSRSRSRSPRRSRSRSRERQRYRSRSPERNQRRRSHERRSPERRSPERRSPERKSPEQRSLERRSPERRDRSRSLERRPRQESPRDEGMAYTRPSDY